MSLIRKHVAVLQAWACLALVYFIRKHMRPQSINRIFIYIAPIEKYYFVEQKDFLYRLHGAVSCKDFFA